MALVVDTSFVWALFSRRDREHARARAFLREAVKGVHGALLTNDYVYAEATALASRWGGPVLAAVDGFFFGEDAPVRVARVDARLFDEARARMLAAPAQGLSLTDWSLVAQAQRYRARAIATFDARLGRAFGAVLP